MKHTEISAALSERCMNCGGPRQSEHAFCSDLCRDQKLGPPPLIRPDATLDDLLDWYHLAEGADREVYLLDAMRQFPHWAGELFEHAAAARYLDEQPEPPPLTSAQEEQLMEIGRQALQRALSRASTAP